jgi:hypothetical protein
MLASRITRNPPSVNWMATLYGAVPFPIILNRPDTLEKEKKKSRIAPFFLRMSCGWDSNIRRDQPPSPLELSSIEFNLLWGGLGEASHSATTSEGQNDWKVLTCLEYQVSTGGLFSRTLCTCSTVPRLKPRNPHGPLRSTSSSHVRSTLAPLMDITDSKEVFRTLYLGALVENGMPDTNWTICRRGFPYLRHGDGGYEKKRTTSGLTLQVVGLDTCVVSSLWPSAGSNWLSVHEVDTWGMKAPDDSCQPLEILGWCDEYILRSSTT